MNRLQNAAQSLAGEARGMTRKLPGVHVAILVFDAKDSALAVVHDTDALSWDWVAARLKGTAEEIRDQLRAAKP